MSGIPHRSRRLCIEVIGVQKTVERRTAALEFHVHRGTRKLEHQLGCHRLAVVHRQDQAVAVGGNGPAGGRVEYAVERAGAEIGNDAVFGQAFNILVIMAPIS